MTSNLKTAAIVLSITLLALAIWRRGGDNTGSRPEKPPSGNDSGGIKTLPQRPRGTQYKCRDDWFYKEYPGATPRRRIILEPPIPGAEIREPNGDFFQGTDYGCYIPVSAGKCVAFKLDSQMFSSISNEWQKCDPKSADVNGRTFKHPDTGKLYYFFGSDYLFILQ